MVAIKAKTDGVPYNKRRALEFVRPQNARFEAIYNSQLGWAVADPDGFRVTEWGLTEEWALSIAKQKQELAEKLQKKMIRPCMCCQKLFESEGKHNRLCDFCRRAN